MADGRTSVSAYAYGVVRSSVHAYLRASISLNFFKKSAYLLGGIHVNNSIPVYMYGYEVTRSSLSAYISPQRVEVKDSIFAYTYGTIRSNISAYCGGVEMAQVDHIWFKTSDNGATLSKKFRVLQQDYDDGTLEKTESVNKTIGGGIDHSVGAIYKTWSMIVKVRHTETETDYGDKDDLEYFYSLNNPGGTPSNDITFIDHHQVTYTVHTVGKLTKNLLGCQVEGECAWYLYKLQLLRVQ